MRGGEVRRSALCVIVVGLLVALPWFAGRPGSAGAVVPCPHSGGRYSALSVGGSTPSPLNPCPGQEWAKAFGTADYDVSVGVEHTNDGGFVLLVMSSLTPATIVRYNVTGTLLWQRSYDRGGAGGFAGAIKQTADGGYVWASDTNLGGIGGRDVILYKLDALGAIAWQTVYGTAGNDDVRTLVVAQDGGYLLAGYTIAPGGDWDHWVVRVDSTGSVLWQKRFGGTVLGSDQAFTAVGTSDGGFAVGGQVYVAGSAGPDSWVIRLDSGGNVMWQKVYKFANYLGSLRTTIDGGYVAAGNTNGKTFVTKLDANGVILWQKTYGTTGPANIFQTGDGGYVLAAVAKVGKGASANNDIEVMNLDVNGAVVWAKTYGGSGEEGMCNGNCLDQALDGTYLVAGYTKSFGAGSADAWLLKLASNGGISTSPCPSGIGANVSPSVATAGLTTSSPSYIEAITSGSSAAGTATSSLGSLTVATQCSA